jgi:hypothetical protein
VIQLTLNRHGWPNLAAVECPSISAAARLAASFTDLRSLDWHHSAAVTALIPALSCRSCRPHAPFAELVCLSKCSVAEDFYAEYSGNRWVSE